MRVKRGSRTKQFENCGSNGHRQGSRGASANLSFQRVPRARLPLRDQRCLPGCFYDDTSTHGSLQGSHLYFHTVLGADHMAQEKVVWTPGCQRRICVSLWSCPGPANTQMGSMIVLHFPNDNKKTKAKLKQKWTQKILSNHIFMTFTTKFKWFQSYFQCLIGKYI